MNRRQGFTITELLVSLALIIFVMLILTEAFSAGLETFRRLKAIGDMQERMRTASITLRRDLIADHFTDKVTGPRLSDQACNLGPPKYHPPQEGYFRIWQQPVDTSPARIIAGTHNSIVEGDEAISGIGLPSTRATTHVLQFTCRRPTHRAERDSFRTVNVPPSLDPMTNPNHPWTVLNSQGPEAYRSASPSIMNTPWYEVVYFLKPMTDSTGAQLMTTAAPGETPTPLYALYRRERAISVHNQDPMLPREMVPISGYEDVSTGSIVGPPPARVVNLPEDVTDPRCRFGMHHSYASFAGRPVPPVVPPATYPSPYYPTWTLGDELTAGAARIGDDILLTEVISFDVKVLQQGWYPIPTMTEPFGRFVPTYFHPTFIDLPPPALSNNSFFQPPSMANPLGQNWSVFDTWCAQSSAQFPPPMMPPTPDHFATDWWSSGHEWSLPLRIRIHAIQITFRVWDQKTEQARQVSLIQDM